MGSILKIIAGLVLALLVLAGVMVVRALSYGADPAALEITLPDAPKLDIDRAAENLAAAMRIKTITTRAGDPMPGREGPWLAFRDLIETTYPEVLGAADRQIVGGLTLLYTWEGSKPDLAPIILMAHQDVVPINLATIDDWTHGPHSGVIADGHVWGRGAIDDKGSLIMILEAANALAASGWKPERTIIFLFGHDEEVSGAGAQAAFAALKDQGVDPYMVLDEGAVVIEENPLTGSTTGLIGVSEKGYVSLQISVATIGGHSSRPPRESGAVRIARAITALEDNQMPADLAAPPFLDSIHKVGRDLPFTTRLAFANTWALGRVIKGQADSDATVNALLRTTTAPTMMAGSVKDNILPQRAFAVVNFRVHPANTVEDVLAHAKRVTSHIEGLVIERYGDSLGSEPSPVSSTESYPYKVLEAVASNTGGGVPVMPMLVLGATDARYATAIADDNIYRFTPVLYTDEDLAGFHGTNERISLHNLERMGEGYAQIMIALAGPGQRE